LGKLFSSDTHLPSCAQLPRAPSFLHERLVNTSVLHQVAHPFLKNIPVVIEHPGAASGKLPAVQQDKCFQALNFAWHSGEPYVDFVMVPHQRRQSAGSFRQEEATMELRMRLNVLVAIISFAFLTAIVVGML
jgi:hypothetical protein